MILLTSTTPPVIKDLFELFLNDSKPRSVVFIETAAEIEDGDKQWLEDDYNSWVSVGLDITRYTVSGKTIDELEQDLSNFDILYVSGGNTFYLLQEMQKSGADKVIVKLVQAGKHYVGTSAGSVVAGPDISIIRNLDDESAAPELQDYNGLALTDTVVLPHWGSVHFKESYLNNGFAWSYANPIHKIVLLTDNQYIHCREDGSIKIYDTSNDV